MTPNLSETVVGLDIGTSFVKAARVDATGRVIKLETRPVSVKEDHEGHATLDPNEVRRESEECLKMVLDATVAGIGCSAAMHSLLWVDVGGNPQSAVSTWLDRSASGSAPRLKDAHPDWWDRTGTPIHPMSPAVRIWDWKQSGRRYPGRPLAMKDWLIERWTGSLVTDFATAAASGMLSRKTRGWDTDVLSTLGLDVAELPRVVDPKTIPGAYHGVPLVVGTTDGAATQFGLNAVGCVGAVSLGTSGAVRRLVTERAQPLTEAGLFGYAVDRETTLIGGALSDAGNLVDWWAGLTGQEVDTILSEALREGPPADGLLVVPFLHGARAPYWDPRMPGGVIGLRSHHTRAQISAALVDSILLSLKLVALRMTHTLGLPSKFRVSGGLFQHAGLAQWAANILEAPIELQEGRDAAIMGAAWLAARALDWPVYASLAARCFEPQLGREEGERLELLEEAVGQNAMRGGA